MAHVAVFEQECIAFYSSWALGSLVTTCTCLFVTCRSIEELQKVARGEMLFSNYKLEVIDKVLPSKASKPGRLPVAPRTTGDMPVIIPDDLIAVQAYVIWEKSGRPQVRGAEQEWEGGGG
jgi:hypothetical protein